MNSLKPHSKLVYLKQPQERRNISQLIPFASAGSNANALTNAIDIFYLTTLGLVGMESGDGGS